MTLVALAFWCWIAFIVSWWGASWWVARATVSKPVADRLIWYAGFTIGFVGLFAMRPPRLWTTPTALAVLLFLVELGCFAFAWWARVTLGRLWSGMMVLREGHRIVDTGPYALVRHPIYTGFIGAAWAFACLSGGIGRLAGAAALTVTMVAKSRAEERWLAAELGAADYAAYARRTPALVPRGLPRRHRRL